MGKLQRIGILTGGGDCPGLNATIRAVAKSAIIYYNSEVIGIKDGYLGLIENRFTQLSYEDVSGILTEGGTILGTSNKANPFRHPTYLGKRLIFKDYSKIAIDNAKKMAVDGIVCIGGDGTLSIANRLYKKGLKVVGIPKTIDNDLHMTDVSIGFDSALVTATEAIDKLHTTAQSHHRVMVIEVMGRYAGWLALCAGMAGGGDIILIPEIPFDINRVCKKVAERNKKGKRFSIVVVAEGARQKGGRVIVQKIVKESTDPLRLGGIGNVVAKEIERRTALETRATILGHLQRGGAPSAFDRLLATRLGTEATNLVIDKEFGKMVALKGNEVVVVNLVDAVRGPRKVPLDSPLIKSARAVGTSFGDF